MTKPKGRPRQFDELKVKQAILQTFWEKGFAATSLDDLSKATDLVRPSLYGAFGSKTDMYVMALDTFLEKLTDIRMSLGKTETHQEALEVFLLGMTDVYYDQTSQKQLGCFLVGTALTEAPNNPIIREALAQRMAKFEQMLEMTLKAKSPSASSNNIKLAVEQATAVMHSLAVRARTGEPQQNLSTFARTSSKIIASLLKD